MTEAGAEDATPAKKCFKCEVVKPITEFYRHPMMADGHLGKCKPCTRRDVQEDRAKKREYYAEYDRQRYNANPARVIEAKIPEHEAARKVFRAAVARREIVKPKQCQDCGIEPPPRHLHGHHEDYNKPLEVVWVCRWCHGKRHRVDPERRTT